MALSSIWTTGAWWIDSAYPTFELPGPGGNYVSVEGIFNFDWQKFPGSYGVFLQVQCGK